MPFAMRILSRSVPIEELNLPVRSFNSLRREGVHTVGGLAARTEKELLAIDGLGPQSIKEIKSRLADHGLAPLVGQDALKQIGGTPLAAERFHTREPGSGYPAGSRLNSANRRRGDLHMTPNHAPRAAQPAPLAAHYAGVRAASLSLAAPLSTRTVAMPASGPR